MHAKESKSDIEDYLQLGWYHLFLMVIFQLSIYGSCVNISYMVFAGTKPKLTCPNLGIDQQLESPEVCAAIRNGTCTNLSMTADFYSINLEWNLTCDDASYVFAATSIQMAGVLLGTPLFGQLSDIWGRKPILFGTWLGQLLVGILSAWSPSWVWFTVARFVSGLFCGGVISAFYVFATEHMPHRHRVWYKSVMGWPVAYIAFAWTAYFCQDWRTLAWVANVVPLPAWIVGAFFLSDSPRSLVQRGKTELAKSALLRINWWSGRTIDMQELTTVLENQMQTTSNRIGKKHSFWHLCYSVKLTKYTLTLMLIWFTTGWVSYGILLNAGKLHGSLYINITIYGCLRWLTGLCLSVLDLSFKRCGRKLMHLTAVAIMALCCYAVLVLILAGVNQSDSQSIRYLNLVAAVASSPVWLIVYLASVELYPTSIRNLANSFGGVFARVGAMFAPQVLYLSDFWPPAMYLLFALFLTVDFVVFFIIIPETKGQPLPEDMPHPSERICFKKNKRQKQLSATESATERSESFCLYKFNRVVE